jgi:hypothetical protein
MPEEDDDALGQMLGDRLKGSTEDPEQEASDETDVDTNEIQEESAQSSESNEETTGDTTESTQRTQSTDTTPDTTSRVEKDAVSSSQSEDNSVRSRSPFPLYVTPDLKETVQHRFETFNAHRTLNDEPQVEKHKHFMEGLLRAGLAHSELEEYILSEFEDN